MRRLDAVRRQRVARERVGVRQRSFHARYLRHRGLHDNHASRVIQAGTARGRLLLGGTARRSAARFCLHQSDLIFVDAQRWQIELLLFVWNVVSFISDAFVLKIIIVFTQERCANVLGNLVARTTGLAEVGQLLVEHAFKLWANKNIL